MNLLEKFMEENHTTPAMFFNSVKYCGEIRYEIQRKRRMENLELRGMWPDRNDIALA